ncbi:MAG TPA: hypothetical protein V6D23_14765 [Candidatus Obscuribacterales bacterium]
MDESASQTRAQSGRLLYARVLALALDLPLFVFLAFLTAIADALTTRQNLPTWLLFLALGVAWSLLEAVWLSSPGKALLGLCYRLEGGFGERVRRILARNFFKALLLALSLGLVRLFPILPPQQIGPLKLHYLYGVVLLSVCGLLPHPGLYLSHYLRQASARWPGLATHDVLSGVHVETRNEHAPSLVYLGLLSACLLGLLALGLQQARLLRMI